MTHANGLAHRCARCGVPYDWQKSTSRSLRMTYCSSLCEATDLGSTIESLLTITRAPQAAPAKATRTLIAAAKVLSPDGCPRCGADWYLDEDGGESCIECGARVIAMETYPPRTRRPVEADRRR
jgi:DNA-directed RNA polymerase subunit RPC12/RpoP